MPAEDDRTFLTRRFEKLLTEKVASSRSHRYRKRPGLVPVVELNRYGSRVLKANAFHKRSLHRSGRVHQAASKTVVPA
ncbi:hypothetical protein BSZ21_07600 [Bradyrhizobium canariense]|nr:hypothetical protein BSZ21_07600 [Bradyrhizobium canariense]